MVSYSISLKMDGFKVESKKDFYIYLDFISQDVKLMCCDEINTRQNILKHIQKKLNMSIKDIFKKVVDILIEQYDPDSNILLLKVEMQ